MSLSDELHDLAGELTGVSWRTKFMDEWTPQEEAAFERASDTEKMAHLEWMMDEPITVVPVQKWTDGHLVHRLTRTYHKGRFLQEHDTLSVINRDEQRYGVTGVDRDEYIRESPESATPSERAALGLTLPPAYPGIIYEDPFKSIDEG